MKLSCVRENLAKALSALGRVVTTSSTLPILGNVLLQTDQGRLKISATDLEMGVNYWVGAKIETQGKITIPARVFTDYVNNNTDENIELEVENQLIKLNSEHYSTKINGLSAEEFPIIPAIKNGVEVKLNVEMLKDAVSKVVFAAAIGETNPTLAGVLFKVEGNKLKVVATDGYRLAEKIVDLETPASDGFAVIVPTKTIQELYRLLGNVGGEVRLLVADNQILFGLEGMEIVSRLIEGNYPAYEGLMPQSYVTRVMVGTKELLSGAKMAAVFSRESQKIRLVVDKDKNRLVSMSKGQLGENVSNIGVEVEGVGGEITFNTRYLSDVLNVVGAMNVVLEMTDKLKPGLIKPVNDDNYRYIIMPVKD
ncbi:MAG: DNA polymerase III subunit beta [Patescibacteria group bacterium]